MSVPAFLMRALYLHMRDEGLALEDALRGLGWSGRSGARQRETFTPCLTPCRRPCLRRRPDLALQMERLHAAACARDVRRAARAAAPTPARTPSQLRRRFLPLLQAGGEIRLVETGNLAIIHFEPGVGQEPERRFAIELALSMMVTVGRHFLGRVDQSAAGPAALRRAQVLRRVRQALPLPGDLRCRISARAAVRPRPCWTCGSPWPTSTSEWCSRPSSSAPCAVSCPEGRCTRRVRAILERDSKLLSQDTLPHLAAPPGPHPRARAPPPRAPRASRSPGAESFGSSRRFTCVVEMDLPLEEHCRQDGLLGFDVVPSCFQALDRLPPRRNPGVAPSSAPAQLERDRAASHALARRGSRAHSHFRPRRTPEAARRAACPRPRNRQASTL